MRLTKTILRRLERALRVLNAVALGLVVIHSILGIVLGAMLLSLTIHTGNAAGGAAREARRRGVEGVCLRRRPRR